MKSLLLRSVALVVCLSLSSAGGAETTPTVAGRTLQGWADELPSSDRTQRLRAAKTVGIFGAAAIPTLVEMLTHEDASVRYWAASGSGIWL